MNESTKRVRITLVAHVEVELQLPENMPGADPRELEEGQNYGQDILFEDEIHHARLLANAERPLGGYEWAVTDVRVMAPRRRREDWADAQNERP